MSGGYGGCGPACCSPGLGVPLFSTPECAERARCPAGRATHLAQHVDKLWGRRLGTVGRLWRATPTVLAQQCKGALQCAHSVAQLVASCACAHSHVRTQASVRALASLWVLDIGRWVLDWHIHMHLPCCPAE